MKAITAKLKQIGEWVALGGCVVVVGLPFAVVSVLLWGWAKDQGGDKIERLGSVQPVMLPSDRRVYVALGDSYSAGEGVRPYIGGTGDPKDGGDRCHRSRDAYARQIMFKPPVTIRFRACSGAKLPDMFRRQPTDGGGSRIGPQLARGVLGPDVGLVTLTIGGNDLGFANVLAHCARHAHCLDDVFDDSKVDGRRSGLTLRSWAERRLPEVVDGIQKLLERLRADAPNARVLVLGYPNLFWTSWPDVKSSDCILQYVFGLQEVNPLLDMQFRLSKQVAAAAHRTGAEFVWTAPVFKGHEACAAITPRWLDFVPLSGLGAGPLTLDPGAMHPNRNGQYILSRIVSCYLAANPRPVAEYDFDRLQRCARDRT